MCKTAEELLSSEKFRSVLNHFLEHLREKNSPLPGIFISTVADENAVNDPVRLQ